MNAKCRRVEEEEKEEEEEDDDDEEKQQWQQYNQIKVVNFRVCLYSFRIEAMGFRHSFIESDSQAINKNVLCLFLFWFLN